MKRGMMVGTHMNATIEVEYIYHSPRATNLANAWGMAGDQEEWSYLLPDGKHLNILTFWDKGYTNVWISAASVFEPYYWKHLPHYTEPLTPDKVLPGFGYEVVAEREPLMTSYEKFYGQKEKEAVDDW
jgi:hypothetical protein